MLANQKNINNIEKIIFYAAAIFLPSALPLTLFLILILLIISFSKKIILIGKKPVDFLIILTVILMLISCIFSSINIDNFNLDTDIENFQRFNMWLDLLNWFPLFLIYWVSQKFLLDSEDRIKFAKLIFIGTIPVIISCILQYWFKIYGPFEFLFGSIVWFQKPITSGVGVSGLFSNQNYSGAWLSTILPFSIILVLKNNHNFYKKTLAFLITIFQSYFIVLSNSRNALIGLLISLIFIFGSRGLLAMMIGFSLFLFFTLIYSFLSPLLINEIFNEIFSNQLIMKITNFDFSNFMVFPRIEIFYITLNLISERPIFGYGSGTFPSSYLFEGGIWNAQHTHNLTLQIAYNYGIPVAISISLIFILLFIRAFKKIFLNNAQSTLIDKCWFISFSIIYILNMTDITYYDGKISILIWILLSGLNCINEEKEKKIIDCKNFL